MQQNTPNTDAVKATLDSLIHSVSGKDFDHILNTLENVYHEKMKIHLIGADNTLQQMNKEQFKNHVAQSAKEAKEPITWAKYHLVEADDKNGHIIISRKINLTGEIQIINLSIDFIFEDGRWQITREVIYLG